MSLTPRTKAKQAFTLVELLVVVGIVVILFGLLLPAGTGNRSPAGQIRCMSNLKQIALGLIMYAQDHKDLLPWQVAINQGGTEELIQIGDSADHFVKLASYRLEPRVFFCPTDKERRVGATNYFGFTNTNLSYFAALLTTMTNWHSILAGDRHLAFNNQTVKPGLFLMTNNTALSWTKALHFGKKASQTVGLLAFADGHCEVVKSAKLPAIFQRQGLVTNRLLIP